MVINGKHYTCYWDVSVVQQIVNKVVSIYVDEEE